MKLPDIAPTGAEDIENPVAVPWQEALEKYGNPMGLDRDLILSNVQKARSAGHDIDPNNLSYWQLRGFNRPDYEVPKEDGGLFGALDKMVPDTLGGALAFMVLAGTGLNALAGAGAAGAGMSASELASADIALGGAGGSAGAASLGAASSGGFLSDIVQKGVDFLGGGEGGGFDLGKMFNSFSDGVKSFFSPAADSPWGANAISDATTGMAGDTAGSLIESQMGMGETIATKAADAAGIATSAGDVVTGGAKKGVIDQVLDWGKANPALASGALQLGGGLLKGVGDSAAMDKKIAAEKEIAAGRSPEAILAAQRAQAASSGAYGQKVGFGAPAAPRMLRRPDGSLVYAQPGLIAGRMGG